MAKLTPIFTGPWYPWYVDDVLTSERIQWMTLAEEAAYRRALDNAWKKGSVPADPELCAKTIGKGCSPEMAKSVLTMFETDPKDPSRMINKKLEQVRKEQKRIHLQKSKAGKEGMRKRWKGKASVPNSVITAKERSYNNLNTNTKEEFKDNESVRVPVRDIFIGTVTSELTKRLDLKTLPAKLEWEHQADWAHANGFTSDDFLECHDLLTRQHWRDGPVKPKHVTENLPNLGKLRKEIEKQEKNGTSIQNGTRNSTDARAERAVQKHNVIEAAKSRIAERERARGVSGSDTGGGE
jgi:hypothetical protein